MDYTPPDKHTFTACRQTRLKLNNLWKGIQPQVGLEALDFQRDGSQQVESIQKAFQIVWLWTLSKNFKLTHWYCILTSKEIKSSNRKQCKGFTACLFVWLFVDLLRTKVALLLILLKWSLFELFLCKGDRLIYWKATYSSRKHQMRQVPEYVTLCSLLYSPNKS